MEFKEFFSMMKNRISDGADIPYFFKDLIAMITDVPEEAWNTPKDPSTKLTKENTLRTYAKRGVSEKFAQSIVYKLSPENFAESLNSRPKVILKLLADDYKAYDPTTTEDDVAQKLAECFVEIIRRTAGLVEPTVLEKQRLQNAEVDLRNRFGSYLLSEENHTCPFPGCGRMLTISGAGKSVDSFNVALIDKKKAPEIKNLLALCPRCYAVYSIDDNKKIMKELVGVKKILMAHYNSVQLLDELPLEKGVVGVLKKIKNLKEKDLATASMDPKEIQQKLPPADNMVLYVTINAYVTAYYVRLREIMTNADKSGLIDYEVLQDQIKAIYRRLKKAKKTDVEIFNEITEKIHKVSLQEEIYCQIVVSYFVQSCEVFDATT